MRFQRLDLNLLVALDALLSEEKLIDAARRLNLSQSAMSGALSRLRQYFNDELFVPQGRRMMPTPLARSLAKPVRDVLLEVQSRITNRESFDPPTSGRTFRVASSDYVATVLLTDVCRRLSEEAPFVRLEIVAISPDAHARLDRGDFDLLILPEAYADAQRPTQFLFSDTFTCIAWRDNPDLGDTFSFEEYQALGHVVPGLGTARAPTIEQHLVAMSGLHRRIEVVVPSFTNIAPFVVGTNRLATLQSRLAKLAAKHLPLRLLEPPLPTPVLTETMQWHAFQTEDPGHTWLRKMLVDCAAKLHEPNAEEPVGQGSRYADRIDIADGGD